MENLLLQNEYQARINKVMDYIEANLCETHTLEELAAVANFSRFHFHRIFLAMTGETPFQFLTRIRLEKAANLLLVNDRISISEVAFQCGFSSLALFSRTFRQMFKKSPTDWKSCSGNPTNKSDSSQSNQGKTKSNHSQQQSNSGITSEVSPAYFCPETKTLKWRTTMKLNKSIEVKEFPKMTVAYLRHTGPYQGNPGLFQKLVGELCQWAGPRGLFNQPDPKMLVVYHDDPKVTRQEKLRISVSLTVPPETKVEGKIGKMEIAAGSYAVGRFEVDSREFSEAWDWMYGTWLPQSGYQPDDGPCFEIYPEEPKEGDKIKVDICIPVKPL